MPNEERGLGGSAERAAAPLLAQCLWLLRAPLSGLGSSPPLSQGVAPPRSCWHQTRCPPTAGGVCRARGPSCAALSIEMLGMARAAWISSYD